jgi:hypothetical protein
MITKPPPSSLLSWLLQRHTAFSLMHVVKHLNLFAHHPHLIKTHQPLPAIPLHNPHVLLLILPPAHHHETKSRSFFFSLTISLNLLSIASASSLPQKRRGNSLKLIYSSRRRWCWCCFRIFLWLLNSSFRIRNR